MMGLFPEGIGQIQILEPAIAKWKVQEMSYVGSFAPVNLVFARRKDAPAKTVEDMKRIPSNVGCSGRTGQSFENPAALNAFAGFKFKIICGYPGSAEFTLALFKGEIDLVSSGWNQWTAEHPGEIKDGTFVPVIQCGLTRHKDIPDVPLMQELVSDPKAKLVMNLLCAAAAIGRDLSLPPQIPADRLDALRAAFEQMVKDPAMIAEAAACHLELDPKSGAEVQRISDSILDTPADVLASAGEAFK
jgi:tripartite-type tricarboxylate transporter receptor subunit TctC